MTGPDAGGRVVDAASDDSRRDRTVAAIPRFVLAAAVIASVGLVATNVLDDAPGRVDVPVAASSPPPDGAGAPSPASPLSPTSPAAPRTEDDGPWPVSFSGPTGAVALFGADPGRVVAVDLDTGTAREFRLPVEVDPVLARVGGQLVTGPGAGTGRVLALVPGTDAPISVVGAARRYVAAADPDLLWLVNETSRVGEATSWTATLVDTEGRQLAHVTGTGEPVRGVPGGLASRRRDGRLVVHDATATVGWRPDVATATVVDASADRVVSCDEGCRTMRVTDATGTAVSFLSDTDVAYFEETSAWLSDDGSRLAVVAWVQVAGGGIDRELRVYDTATGLFRARADLPLGRVRGDWIPGAPGFLFAVSAEPVTLAAAPRLLGRWRDGDGIELVDVGQRLSGLGDLVALPRETVAGLFPPDPAAAVCTPSPTSTAMGDLPAQQGERVHVAVLDRSEGPAAQLWFGFEDAATTPATLSARRLDGPGLALFRRRDNDPWRAELQLRDGVRLASGFPAHWGVSSYFSQPGCWKVTVATAEFTDTVTFGVTSAQD